MTNLYDFVIETLRQLRDALQLIDFSVFNDDWSTMTYDRFLVVFLGGSCAFSALYFGWKKAS